MLILFGATEKSERIGGGTFHCPVCKSSQRYERMQGRRHFTLFFIPVLPLDRTGEYIRCEHCKARFDPRVV
jgi:hypothetical protein